MMLNDVHHFHFAPGEELRVNENSRAVCGSLPRKEGKLCRQFVTGMDAADGQAAGGAPSPQGFRPVIMGGEGDDCGAVHARILQRADGFNITDLEDYFLPLAPE
jgi:hypothetical protein